MNDKQDIRNLVTKFARSLTVNPEKNFEVMPVVCKKTFLPSIHKSPKNQQNKRLLKFLKSSTTKTKE